MYGIIILTKYRKGVFFMYLNFVEILSIVLLALGIILLIIGKLKKIKCIWITGIVFFTIIFIIWSTIFIEGFSEKAPEFNEESNYTFQEDVSKDDTNKQPQDATQDILNGEFYFTGSIYNIDENYIYFSRDNEKKYYIDKNAFSYLNGRTTKDMNIVDVKVGDYLLHNEGKIIIYRNIVGEELNQELLYNFTLTPDERIMFANSIEIEDIKIVNGNIALVKIKYGDLIGNDLTNETFEALIEFNSNTKFYSKGGNINSINDLETAKYNINSIVLDRNTINKKNPAIVTIFDSSDT